MSSHVTAIFDADEVQRAGNSLSLKLLYKCDFWDELECAEDLKSLEFIINDAIVFQSRIIKHYDEVKYFVKFTKAVDSEYTYSVIFDHKIENRPEFDLSQKYCTSDDSNWRLIYELRTEPQYLFEISMTVSLSTSICVMRIYTNMHGDEKFTDFELRGEDGSVHLHRAVVAAASPVMKASCSVDWGKKEKCVSDAPPRTSKTTLQHLKDYIYLDKLPDSDEDSLKELLLLASYYIMPHLEQRCVHNLLTNTNSEKADKLIEFGMKYQNKCLLLAIIRHVKNGDFEICEKMVEE